MGENLLHALFCYSTPVHGGVSDSVHHSFFFIGLYFNYINISSAVSKTLPSSLVVFHRAHF